MSGAATFGGCTMYMKEEIHHPSVYDMRTICGCCLSSVPVCAADVVLLHLNHFRTCLLTVVLLFSLRSACSVLVCLSVQSSRISVLPAWALWVVLCDSAVIQANVRVCAAYVRVFVYACVCMCAYTCVYVYTRHCCVDETYCSVSNIYVSCNSNR